MAINDLAEWLSRFDGTLRITANGTGIMASNKLGRHYFSLVGYDPAEVDHLIDTIFPYL